VKTSMMARSLMLSVLAPFLVVVACSSGSQSGAGGIGSGGAGGSGPCKSHEVVVEQLVVTEVVCDLAAPFSECADLCDVECVTNDFELGSRGSGCAREMKDEPAYCRCVCRYCRAN